MPHFVRMRVQPMRGDTGELPERVRAYLRKIDRSCRRGKNEQFHANLIALHRSFPCPRNALPGWSLPSRRF